MTADRAASAPSVTNSLNDRSPAVRLRDLEKRFGDFVAVNRISLDVKQGEIFGFLGPNGAGKSTTIRMLCGILAPSGGSGTVAGFDIVRQPEEIKKNIGYMSQKFSLYDDLTVEENIDFYSGIYRLPSGKKKERKEWVIHMAGLEERRTSRTSVLSGGWKQRLALGCAILHEPPVIFLDEPTSGVDPLSRRNFWDLIYHLAGEGVTVFVTTHYMDEAEYCDRLGLIYRGELIADGAPEELKNRYMAGRVVELIADRPLEALAIAESYPGIKYATLFGTKLHVVEGLDGSQGLTEALDARGVTMHSRETVSPTLEDVFISLIEERDRQEGVQQEVAR